MKEEGYSQTLQPPTSIHCLTTQSIPIATDTIFSRNWNIDVTKLIKDPPLKAIIHLRPQDPSPWNCPILLSVF